MRVLITGGSGFFGLHMGRHLLEDGHQLVLYDLVPIDLKEYEEIDGPLAGGWQERITFCQGDVRDRSAVACALKGVDAVIHAAAALPLWSPKDILTTNIVGTDVVLSVARSLNVPRVLFVSSTSVYGIPEKHPLYESDPLSGVGLYGTSKIWAERICDRYRKMGMTVTVIRPKTFVGPGRLGVFQILFDWIDRGKPIPLIGWGANRYQLLDVGDLTDAVVQLLTAPDEVVNDVFNIGATRFGTVWEDVSALCEYAGTGAHPFPTPARVSQAVLHLLEALRLSPLYKWVYMTADKDSFVSTDRIRSRLNWEPRYSNVESLIRTYEWYQRNRTRLNLSSGVTHRSAWEQGALRLLRDILPSGSVGGRVR